MKGITLLVCLFYLVEHLVCNVTTPLTTTLDDFVEITSTELTTTLEEFVVVAKNETSKDSVTPATKTEKDLTSSSSKHSPDQTVTNCDKRWSQKDYILSHPGFPEKYNSNELCRYTISRHASSICGLEITFKKFDIETSTGCEKDFLAIGDERLCGHIPPQSVVQYPFEEDSNDIILVFGTNDNITKSGFQILFQQISICEDLNAIPAIHACDVLVTDPSGELVTHRSPEDALGDPVCRYTIGRRHSGYCQVELDFVDFNVDYSPGCINSYVQLDGHRFCGTSLRGQRKNVTFDVLGNVHLVYKTETVRLDRGFHLLFRQLACPSGIPVRSPGGGDVVSDRLPTSCSKIYQEKEFYVESPGFPSFYPNDLDCQLVVRRFRPSICRMDIRFLDFDVEDSPGCVYDFLQIDAQRLCGRIPEDNVQTTDFHTYEKILRFKTDSVNPRPGFFLYVRQLDCGPPAPPPPSPLPGGCDVHVWDRESRISSPGYPGHYGNDLRCRYTVHRVGEHVCHLRITFLDFRLQDGSPGCRHDYLEMDGGWRACGDKFQGVTRTLDFRSPEKVIFFSTDSWVTYPGFLLSLKQLSCSESAEGVTSGRLNGDPPSCDREFESSSFELRSELYPLNYSPGLNCRYLVRKVSDVVCQLSIRFTHFNIEPSLSCSNDYLALDGERLCGSLPLNTTKILRFDTTEKALLFHSNGDIQGPGFSAVVRQIECPGGRPALGDGTSPGISEDSTSSSFNPTQDLPCNQRFTELRSTFSSPNYPSTYPMDSSCRYMFHMQHGYCKLEITFLEFLLEPPSPGLPCTRDFLDISGVRYCGRQLHGITKLEPPYGTASEIILTFVSDGHVADRGFLASFRQLPCGSAPPQPPPPPPRGSAESIPGSPCGGYLSGPYFEVQWPDLSLTGDYGQTVQCVYTVHRSGSDTCSLRVTFVTFDFGDGLDCPRQFAQIGDHTICGRLPAYTVREYEFRGYTMTFRMTSSQLPRPRMYLQVTQVPCGANNPPPRISPTTCDETYLGPGFELRSPYYPHGISTSVDCRYIVRKNSPFTCHLEMTFERFSLPESRHCYSTHMRIDTERLCGTLTPFTVKVFDFHTEEKLIHFRADHILPGTGFLIRGRQVACGGSSPSDHRPPALPNDGSRTPAVRPQSSVRCDQSFGVEDFTLQSPSYPLHYPPDAFCRYVVIRASADVCGLEVTFVNFDLEDYYQCQRDYLDIDGEKLCGVLPPQSVRTYVFHPADRTKLIVFRSDYQMSRPGFVLRIRQTRNCPPSIPSLLPGSQVPPPVPGDTGVARSPAASCEPAYLSGARGSFQSPAYPSGYPSAHCPFTFIQLRSHCSVQLYFRDFDVFPSPDCLVDYLEVEGRRYCDAHMHQITREIFFPWSDSSTFSVVFHSDRGAFSRRGFNAEFTQLPCRRQGRSHQREGVAQHRPQGNTTSPTSEWNGSSRIDEDWDDTKTSPRNSTVEYTAA